MSPIHAFILSVVLPLTFALQPFSTWSHERIQLSDTSIHFRYSASGKPPLLLVHGFPQHSPTWTHIGPILAEQFTVIAPDNRGSGESALSKSGNYTAVAAAEDLYAVLNFLNITEGVYVVSHDKGVGLATSLAFEHPELVKKLAVLEYALPGSVGYSTCVSSPDVYRDWQLAFFAVPDAAEFFIRGREREMLVWYFFHGSYSGNSDISDELLETYTRAISKPGFLRSGMGFFAAAWEDEVYFNRKVNETGKLGMPVLAMGGEASFGSGPVVREAWTPYVQEEMLEVDVIPKAGHWIGDENPTWTANRLLRFLTSGNESLPALNLDGLENMITMFGNDGLGGGMLTPGTNGTS